MDPNAETAGGGGWSGALPDRVGPYRVLAMIGEGGFGVVYEAEQAEPVRRRVALKVIKPGMDSGAVVARFEAERQALAVMDHPAIAKVFDGGVSPPEHGSRPYFVMELVKGEPITDFCDRHTLSIEQRVELFVRVCGAVQHAHAKGVIHRDLKPSNVLVGYDGDGVAQPKVIDFGVAKALNQRLTERTVFTERGQLIGTPEYMSPEQAEMSGLDIDTRSDVYSLGVLLYELLTGVLPFDPRTLRAAAFHEIQRIIREVDPPRPSTRLSTVLSGSGDPAEGTKIVRARHTDARSLSSVLRRDLDWVVMKCLEKDRERRYDSVSGLAADLRHYLAGEPVLAGPPTVRYRAGKFIKRHRAALAAGTAVVAVFVLGVAGTGVGYAAAERRRAEAELAERQADAVEAVFLDGLLTGVSPYQDGAQVRLADQIASFADRLMADDAFREASLPPGLRTRLFRLTGETFDQLGMPERAIPLLERALEDGDPDDPDRAWIRLGLVRAAYRAERYNEAEAMGAALLADLRGSPRADREELVLRCRVWLASVKWKRGQLAEAEDLFTELRDEAAVSPGLPEPTRDQIRLDSAHNIQLVRMAGLQSLDRLGGGAGPEASPLPYDRIASALDRIADDKATSPAASGMWVLESRYEAAKARYRAAARLPAGTPERAARFAVVADELDRLRGAMLGPAGGTHWRYIELVDTASAARGELGQGGPALRYSAENYDLNVQRFGRDHAEALGSMRWMIAALNDLGYTDAAAWFSADALRRIDESGQLSDAERDKLRESHGALARSLGIRADPAPPPATADP